MRGGAAARLVEFVDGRTDALHVLGRHAAPGATEVRREVPDGVRDVVVPVPHSGGKGRQLASTRGSEGAAPHSVSMTRLLSAPISNSMCWMVMLASGDLKSTRHRSEGL